MSKLSLFVVAALIESYTLSSGLRRAKRGATSEGQNSGPPVKPQPVVYQIATRPWLYDLAQAGVPANCGNGRGSRYVCLRDVPDQEWQKIKADHADMVWLMGMWELGDEGLQESFKYEDWYRPYLPDMTQEDIIGSPYSVKDYSVNSDIGNDDDLKALREKLHSIGLLLMLDFVPNHFSRDSKLFTEHPEAFLQRPPGDTSPDEWWYEKGNKSVAFGRGPYDGPWTDTLQINYFSKEAVDLVEGVLMKVAGLTDGIRLDMAHLILNEVFARAWGDVAWKGGFGRPQQEFWSEAIKRVKSQYPNVIFLSEAYDYFFTNPPEQQLLTQLGIDYSYNKVVLDKLEEFNLDNMRGYISSMSGEKFSKMCHFIENHDEPRAALALGGSEQSFAGAVAALTLPGMRLTYFGQYDGLTSRLVNQLRRWTPQAPNLQLHARYNKLMEIIAHDVFHQGIWTLVDIPKTGTGWRLQAWRWEHNGEKRLVVVNWSDQQGWGNVQIANALGREGTDDVLLTDLLTGSTYARKASELRGSGLVTGLNAWQAHVFAY